MFYEDVFRALFKHKVRYLVVGGVAVNLYGVLRSTADLDLMLELEDGKNVDRFIAVMKELGYQPRVPVPLEDFRDPAKRKAWQSETPPPQGGRHLGNAKQAVRSKESVHGQGTASPPQPRGLRYPTEELANEKGALVFTFLHPGSYEQVDVFLRDPIPFSSAYERRRPITIADYEITVASLEDLKTMKQKADRERDRSDLANLKKIEDLQRDKK